ncbi:hypothetical protein C8J57DRAFT_1246632 [Mycena rebaudengoi]|nr:hypothetical protein C8J57DRAFT_1246632 [Mycena rebaudengoi]
MFLSIDPASLKTRKRWASEQLERYMGKFKADHIDYEAPFRPPNFKPVAPELVTGNVSKVSDVGPQKTKGSSEWEIVGDRTDAPPSKRAKENGTVMDKRPNVAKKRKAAGETDTDSAVMVRPPKRRREAEEKARSSIEVRQSRVRAAA